MSIEWGVASMHITVSVGYLLDTSKLKRGSFPKTNML